MNHIVFVIGNYKNGGVARRSTNLANELAKKGYGVTILVTREIGENIFFKRHEKVDFVQLDDFYKKHSDNKVVIKDRALREKQIKIYKKLRYLTKSLKPFDAVLEEKIKSRRIEKLRAFFILNKNSIYITFGVSNFERMYLVGKDENIKLIFAEKNASQLELPENRQERERLLNMLSSVNGAVVQTEDEASYYSGYIKDNLAVIHNPIKADLPEAYNGERKKIVTNFCRISAQKNLPLLFEAFEIFHRDYPDYKLEIYGNTVEKNEDDLKNELIKELEKSGRSDYIKILPPSGEVHSIIRDYAMFVSSSDYEGLSNSMIEAMAIGLPCVCTDCLGGGAREIIKDGENGLLVPIKDAEALYKAMKRFITDKELSEKCSKNASKIREDLSAEKIAGKWIEVIEKV